MAPVKVIQGHRFRYQSKAHIRFLAIAFDWSKIALYTPFAFDPPPNAGFPWDDLRKMFRGCQRMAKIPSGVETLPKNSTG